MTDKDRALEVAQNIRRTLNTLTDAVIGSNAIRGNGIWSGTKPNRSVLENKLKTLCKKHDIKKEEL